MQIVRRDHGEKGPAGPPTEQRSATFTGTVYADAMLDGAEGTTVTSVFFAPGGRTFWHSHSRGQVLHVLEGRGLVAIEGDTPQAISRGDIVWAAPGEVHWHGGGPESMLLHLAVSLGHTSWLGPVSDPDYGGGQ
jgi:quercetin dioxygenase-like cupin family protein